MRFFKRRSEKSVAAAPGRWLYIMSALASIVYWWRNRGQVERILIFKLDHLGDLLIATPALRAIRARFPRAEIRIVVGEWNTALLRGNPSVDRVHVYNSARFCRPPNRPSLFRDLREQLGTWRPNLIIGMRDDWNTLGYSFLTGAARVERGRAHIVEYVQRARTKQPLFHELERLWTTLAPLGIEREDDAQLDYFIADDEAEEATRFVSARGIRTPFAMLHAGATQRLREWPIERFTEIARLLAKQWGMQIVLVGIDAERSASSALAASLDDVAVVNVTGELGLRATAALMSKASLYVGSDGGAMHVAAAVGTPTVGLFGPGSFHVFSPIGKRTLGISHNFSCSPCAQINCIRPHDTCMQAISTDEVIAAVEHLLSETEIHVHARTPA